MSDQERPEVATTGPGESALQPIAQAMDQFCQAIAEGLTDAELEVHLIMRNLDGSEDHARKVYRKWSTLDVQ